MRSALLSMALLAPVFLRAAGTPTGIDASQLARQDWILHCQGCHRPDATGSASTAPALKDFVARFTQVPGGRDYLVRVPGVASAPLSDPELAALLNWVLLKFDAADLTAAFRPFTADEVAALRQQPLRTEAPDERRRLMSELAALARLSTAAQ